MQPEGARTFATTAAAYDGFMGRYAEQLAPRFADFAGVRAGQDAIDVGCGPGALTAELARRLGAAHVSACDPSPPFVQACARRLPGVHVVGGAAEALPYPDDSADVALSQLVLHFVSDPAAAAAQMTRVVRPGGTVGSCAWDFGEGMEMLNLFWDAARRQRPEAPSEIGARRFGGPGELTDWLSEAGLLDVREETLRVASAYRDFDELWAGYLAGVGPAGAYAIGLPETDRAELRALLFELLGSPQGGLSLRATARAVRGTVG